MARLPQLLASSVIRGSQLGASHGGVFLVDLERGSVELKLDWNTTAIDISGRGGDRGLRGIGFHRERLLIAANAELLLLDQDFTVLDSFTNPYLRHCHEISVAADRVLLTSTGFDSILAFDLKTRRFSHGWHLRGRDDVLELREFDPLTTGPVASHDFHLNAIAATASGFCFSGLYTPGLLQADRSGLTLLAPLPQGTHNAQLLNGGVLYNDTANDRVCFARGEATTQIAVPTFAARDLINPERFASSVARPGFARGLCHLRDDWVAGGSSPSTITVYDLKVGTPLQQQNLSLDIRNAVHGLAVWPY